MERAWKRLFLWIMPVCVRMRECSCVYFCVGVSYLSQQLIGLLLGLCLDIILKVLLFFSFQALVSILNSYFFEADVFLTISAWL